MAHGGKTTNSSGWNAVFSWIKYALTGKRDETKAVSQSSVSASSLVDLDARLKAVESVLASLDVDDAEDLSVYKILQAAKTFSPDRTKTLSAMSQNENGEMSATFAEVQATVASQNNYTSPGSTKTALSTIFGKIWNFFGMLLKSTGTWNGSSDAQIPTTAAVQAKLNEKQIVHYIVTPTYSGGQYSDNFAEILAAYNSGKDIFLAIEEQSGSDIYSHIVPLVDVSRQGTTVSSFIFSRSRSWGATDGNGIIESWTCSASSPYWVYEGKNVYFATNAGTAGTAVSARNYESGGQIDTAIAGKQDSMFVPVTYGSSTYAEVNGILDGGKYPYLIYDGDRYDFANKATVGTGPGYEVIFVYSRLIGNELQEIAITLSYNSPTQTSSWSVGLEKKFYPGQHTYYTDDEARAASRRHVEMWYDYLETNQFYNAFIYNDYTGTSSEISSFSGNFYGFLKNASVVEANDVTIFINQVQAVNDFILGDTIYASAKGRKITMRLVNNTTSDFDIRFCRSKSGSSYNSGCSVFTPYGKNVSANYWKVTVKALSVLKIDMQISPASTSSNVLVLLDYVDQSTT